MSTLSADEIAKVASQAGSRGKDLATAVAVALAESGGRPRANAAGADADRRDSRAAELLNPLHISPGVGGQVVKGAAVRQTLPPAEPFLVHRQGVVEVALGISSVRWPFTS